MGKDPRGSGMSSVPLWKRWISHLFPIPVRHFATSVHPQLWVTVSRGRYQLSTPHAIYSFEDLYLNFAEAFRHTDLTRLPGKDVLVLGLGLGSVIRILEERFHMNGDYTAVELDEGIIGLAEEFGLADLRAPVTVIAADAEIFLRLQHDRQWDLILLDIFMDDRIPDFFSSADCLDQITRCLSAGGLLVNNRLYRSAVDRSETERYQREIFEPHFPHTAALDVQGNRMLFSDRAYLLSD